MDRIEERIRIIRRVEPSIGENGISFDPEEGEFGTYTKVFRVMTQGEHRGWLSQILTNNGPNEFPKLAHLPSTFLAHHARNMLPRCTPDLCAAIMQDLCDQSAHFSLIQLVDVEGVVEAICQDPAQFANALGWMGAELVDNSWVVYDVPR